MLRWIVYAGIALLVTLAFLYFHPFCALWVAALAVLTRLRPSYGLLLLFLSIPIDAALPTYKGIVLSLSELEFGACLLAWLSGQELAKLRLKSLLWGAPFLLAIAVSGIIRLEWYQVGPHLLRASEILLMLFLTLEVFRDQRDKRRVKVGLALAGLLFAASGLLQLTPVIETRLVSGTRPFSFFNSPNQFAAYLNLLLPFYFFFILTSAGRKIRLVWIYIFTLTLIAQLSALSRTAPPALIVAMLAMSLLHYRTRSGQPDFNQAKAIRQWLRRSGPLLVAHLAGILLVGVFVVPMTSIGSQIQRSLENVRVRSEKSLAGTLVDSRLPYWEIGFQIWRDHPWVGAGPGRYQDVAEEHVAIINRYRDQVIYFPALELNYQIHCHNLFLQLAALYGVLGLAGFLYFLVELWRRALHRFRTDGDCVAIGLLTAFLIHNLVDVSFPSLAMEIGFVVGLALALQSSPDDDSAVTSQTPQERRRAAVAA